MPSDGQDERKQEANREAAEWIPEGMKHSEFEIGKTFICGGRTWRCTDIGTRTIIGICLDDHQIVSSSSDQSIPPKTQTLSRAEAEAEGWFHGPPYAVNESVFDEYDIGGCSPDRDTAVVSGTAPAGRSAVVPVSKESAITQSLSDPVTFGELEEPGQPGARKSNSNSHSATVPKTKRGDHPSPGAALPSDQDGSVHQDTTESVPHVQEGEAEDQAKLGWMRSAVAEAEAIPKSEWIDGEVAFAQTRKYLGDLITEDSGLVPPKPVKKRVFENGENE
jgi:hypothetical protein